MSTAKQIYDELIARVKRTSLVEFLGMKRVVYDPETGVQKFYINDKFIGSKKVNNYGNSR
jgi:hypothetical protein